MSEELTESIGQAVEKTIEAAEVAVRRPFVKRLARLGFYSKGVLFIVVGALAVMLSAGLPEGRIADPSSALGLIAEGSFGKVLLVIFALGSLGHGFWNLLRGLADVDDAGTGWMGILKRSVAVGVGVVYLGLTVTAVEIVLAARVRATPSHAEETLAATLLAVPLLGAVILFLIGLGVIGAAFHECYSGVTGRFREAYRVWEISGHHLGFISVLGILSFTARAVLLSIIGYYFLRAAMFDGANGSIGIDAALRALAQGTYGRVFLFAAASGLFAHGVLAFYEAKYRRIC
jgi:hypothetical protein